MDSNSVTFWASKVFLVETFFTVWNFCWGAHDTLGVATAKRIFLVVPLISVCVGYAATVTGLATVIFRSKRESLLTSLLVCWWDLGRNILTYWGGVFKFVLPVTVAAFGFVRLLFLGLWVTVQDFFLVPFRAIANVGNSVLHPGLPWIAVTLTVLWCVFEAIVFTYVTSPLVVDTLSNLTGDALTDGVIRAPVFMFMLFIALGSYSILSTWTNALKTRNIAQIIKIGAIEAVALTVEVVFLYREFVDALVPWFAQHSSGGLDLGIFGTLAIAGTTWFGIRSLSWFLFASAGTPPIMAIIQGSGLEIKKRENIAIFKGTFSFPLMLVAQLQKEMTWAKNQGQNILEAFLLPPLQVLASGLNFVTTVLKQKTLFDLPFTSLNDLKSAKTILADFESQSTKKKRAA